MVRKTVTLVFCDVADSTALGERLDPEALRDVWSRYHAAARDVFERHGGTIEKFVGDAVMAAFGIPVVHEDDALRAVRAAVELRAAMTELNEELDAAYGVRLEIRTGVNTGHVVAGDPDHGEAFATGDPVVVAQRLEAAAGAGEILVGEATMRLVRDAVDAEALPPLELKGKAAPVPAWRLLDVEPGAAGWGRRPGSVLVGRESELARLGIELGFARAERTCRTITIVGEPGVGKSRLAAELVASLGDEALVLEGRCLPYGTGITYWPLVEITRRLDLDAVLADEPDGEAIRSRILEVTGRADSQSRSDEVYWAVRRLLETLARERPVVLVLDDVQWAEPAFLDLVEYLAGWCRGAAVLVCGLARSEFAEIRPNWPMLRLEPLAPRETVVFLESIAGPLDLAVTRRLRRATGGNPLFLEEMVRMLVEEHALVEREGVLTAEVDSLPVPPTIQAVLAARLDRLPAEERDVLQRAAVIGHEFWWGQIAALMPPEGAATVAGELQALVRKGLIRPDARALVAEDGFRFAHILVRDAAYESMPKQRRGELHERFADWLETRAHERPELDEILGHHLEQARALRLELRAGGPAEEALALRAFESLTRAGRRALGRGDMHAAQSLLERAVSPLAPGDPRRLELVPELALTLSEAGELAEAEALLSELLARAEAEVDELTRLGARIERAALRLKSDPRGGWDSDLGLVQASLPALEARPDPDARLHRTLARGWFLVGLVRGLWAGQIAHGEEALERARIHARAALDRRQETEIVGRLGFAAWSGPMPVDEAITRCATLLEGAEGDPFVEASCRRWLGSLLARQEHFDEARELIDEAVETYESLGAHINAAAAAAFGHADISLLEGDPRGAEDVLRRGYDALEQLGEVGYRASVAALLAKALQAQGRADEAEHYAALVEATASEQDIWSQVLYRLTGARLHAEAGLGAEAEAIAREALEIVADTDLLELHGDVLVVLGDVLRRGGREQDGRDRIEQALALYERKGDVVSARAARERLGARATPA
jgi:class 3 adenylate cyclase/tetratricopeptide (TPR) repeat protein